MEASELRDFTKLELFSLILKIEDSFQKSSIRSGDLSTSIFFFNTKNSVNAYLNIDNKLLADYEIDLAKLLTNAQTGL